MFPFSIEGSIDIPLDGAGAALDRLRVAVAANDGKSIERQPEGLMFRGRWPLAIRMSPIVIFDRCEVSINLGKIAYHCSTMYLFSWVTGLILAFWLLVLLSGPKLSVPFFIIPLVAWAWLFGGNYFLGRARFLTFLTTTVGDAKLVER